MTEPSPPITDPARLSELQRTGLLDSAAEEAFDRFSRLAAKVLRVPVALVSLVDRDRQFFKSQVGLPEPWASLRQTPLSHSFCQHVVSDAKPLIVADAREHPRVRENLAVSELGVIAYAGVPLTTPDGHVLGSFCGIDTKPHEWTSDEIDVLTDLAAAVMTEIELRLTLREAQEQAGRAERLAKRLSLQHAVSSVLTRATSVDDAASRLLVSIGEALGWRFGAAWRREVEDGREVLRCATTWHDDGLAAAEFEAATKSLPSSEASGCRDPRGRRAARSGSPTSRRSRTFRGRKAPAGSDCTARSPSRSGAARRSPASSSSSASGWSRRTRS